MESNPPNAPQQRRPGGGRRRGRRGGRGRNPRRTENPAPENFPPSPAAQSAPEFHGHQNIETEPALSAAPLSRAIEEAGQIIETLKETLAQMEDVLELMEAAEREKLGDEREIDSLRRALRQMHNPRRERHDETRSDQSGEK